MPELFNPFSIDDPGPHPFIRIGIAEGKNVID